AASPRERERRHGQDPDLPRLQGVAGRSPHGSDAVKRREYTAMTSRRTTTGIFAAAVAALMVLTGCSDPSAPADDVPQDLTIGVGNFAPTLDPHQFTADGPLKHIFETLVVTEDDGYGPLLATDWSNPDDLTWVFDLDPAAAFSDGTPLT